MEKSKNRALLANPARKTTSGTQAQANKNHPKGRLNVLGLTMLGIGGAVGSGIFVASGMAINQAGPAIILSFIVGGILSTLVMIMLGEMSVREPTSGSFSVYAGQYLGPALGFISGWIYWLAGILTLSTEMVAAALTVQFWLPTWPIWLISLIIAAVIIGVGLLNVRAFARVEEILSFIKVGVLLIIIIMGAILLSNLWPGIKSPGLTNFVGYGGLFPHGLTGFLTSLLLVLYAYAGEQVIGPATGDTRHPVNTIPEAIGAINIILAVLYLGSITVLVGLVPWDRIPQKASGFVFLFRHLGMYTITGIINAVILIAILSAMNSNMYGVPRMLKSLAERHDAPSFLAKNNRADVPLPAVLASSACLLIVVGISYLLPQNIFAYIASASGVTLLLNWLIIAITHIRFRWKTAHSPENRQPKAGGFPYKAAAAIVLLLVILGTAALTLNQLVGLAAGLILTLVFAGFYFFLIRKRHPAGT
ncbi:GABA permease [Peptococcaceae bacterium CEB3]|nr:GABA permease [Peptococcaceae bacterium CEB3]